MTIFSRRVFINTMLFIALIVLGGTNIFAYIQTQHLIDANNWVTHTHEVIETADQAMLAIIDAESKASLFLLTKDKQDIEDLSSQVYKAYQSIAFMKLLTKDNSYQLENIDQLEPLVKEKFDLMYQIIHANDNNKKNVVITLAQSEKRAELKRQISLLIAVITNHELTLLEKRNALFLSQAKQSNLTLILVGVLSEILFILSVVLLNYQLYQKEIIEKQQLKTKKALEKGNEKLRIIQERYDLAVTGSNIGLWDWKVGTDEVYYSNNFRKLLGYTKTEFPNLFSSFEKVVHPDDHERVMKLVEKHLDDGITYTAEYRLKTQKGEYRWYRAVGEAKKNEQNQNVRMAGSLIDITESKKVEQMKNEFISIVSHELRTPLTSIHGAISLLTNSNVTQLSADANQLLTIAKTNTERLIRLINDILDIEKIESGKMDFSLKTQDLNILVQEAVAINQAYANKFSVKIVIAKEIPSIMVSVDRDRLIQVFTNLLSNAIKFSPPNEAVILDVSVINQNVVRVSISDKGEGIPEEFQEKIFQKFSQADSSSTRKHEGTGLGLNISRAIVERLGGTVNFVTKLHYGTTFYFELPIINALVKLKTETKPTIVIHVINTNAVDQIKIIFKLNHFNTLIANSTVEVEKYIQENKIAAIILDLADVNSVPLIQKIRNQPKYNIIPIAVISTEHAINHSEFNVSAINIIDWIDKPIDNDRLLQAIKILRKNITNTAINILHVEDDADLAKIVSSILMTEANIVNVQSIKDAKVELDQNNYDLAILDLKLSDGFSAELLPILNKKNIPVIVFSAYELPSDYLSYVNNVLTKSKTTNEELLETIKKIIGYKIKNGDKYVNKTT